MFFHLYHMFLKLHELCWFFLYTLNMVGVAPRVKGAIAGFWWRCVAWVGLMQDASVGFVASVWSGFLGCSFSVQCEATLSCCKADYGLLGFHCSCKSRGICFVSCSRLQKMRTMRVCCHTHQLHLARLALWLFRRHPRSLSLGRISASPCNFSDAVVVLLLHGKQFGLLSLASGQVSDSTNWNVKEEVDGRQGDWQDWQSKESCPWKLRSGLNQNLDNLARASKPSFICIGTLRHIKLLYILTCWFSLHLTCLNFCSLDQHSRKNLVVNDLGQVDPWQTQSACLLKACPQNRPWYRSFADTTAGISSRTWRWSIPSRVAMRMVGRAFWQPYFKRVFNTMAWGQHRRRQKLQRLRPSYLIHKWKRWGSCCRHPATC